MKKKLMMLGLVTMLGATAYGAEAQTIEELKAENAQLKEKLASNVLIVGDGRATEVIKQGDQGEKWNISARTYIENELYSGNGVFGNGAAEQEDIFMLGTGVNAVRGKWGYHLNVEQRLTGHMNTEGADNQNTRVDYKIRYQATPKIGVAFKYRSERGGKKRDVYAAEANRNRDRVELGLDTSYKYLSGWFVVGHDVDSGVGAKNKGNYYEGDMGPSFQLTDTFALRPTFYATGEFYENHGDNDAMNAGQLRLMGVYQATEKLTIMPRVRYTLYKTIESDSQTGSWNNYTAQGRIRAELLTAYTINDRLSIDGGIAYDMQTRKYTNKVNRPKDSDFDMIWYTMGVNYKF